MSAAAYAVSKLRGGRSCGAISPLPSQQLFLGVSSLLFAASAAGTVAWCGSMSAMPSMPMPGGWTMSMAWMRMPGETWLGAAASFTGMWAVMMIAMMMPSLVPMLQRYRESIGRAGKARLGRLTAVVGAGYYAVWTALGVVVFPLGVAFASIEMQFSLFAHAVPAATGAVMLIAGALQFTRWKAHRLAGCREGASCGHELAANSSSAFRHGVRLGLHCSYCCAGMTAVLLAVGVMDLRAMALVTVAITAERVAPSGNRVARAIGAAIIVAGVIVLARVAGLV